jgi:hypothetical protein
VVAQCIGPRPDTDDAGSGSSACEVTRSLRSKSLGLVQTPSHDIVAVMSRRQTPVIFALGCTVAGVTLVLIFGGKGPGQGMSAGEPASGGPSVSIVSPRNGSVQDSGAAAVKVVVRNFHLAPRAFGGAPVAGEGYLRFRLNRVPDCVSPSKLQRAMDSHNGEYRLVGQSFDSARYSGPNGVLAERIGSSEHYSPATRPEIYYSKLNFGFYRLIATLAENDGEPTGYHDVTTFQIPARPGSKGAPCPAGKVATPGPAGSARR